ncbi:type IV secretion system DNA-binding domain-containing protein [bacterium]|nr:MAG: type IV secretion system DNA-binding domain-containing protein [bacterium]
MEQKEQINFFGKTNFRNRQVPFGIKTDDRRRHMYVIGKTGMGKTTLMENMVIQDIRNGNGVCFIDPHGDPIMKILDFVPPHRINDVVYFNPADLDYPIAFNILESVESRYKHLVASGLMGVFTKIWASMWSSRMEYILNNTILALLDSPGNTMLGIVRMYVDKKYRKKIVDNIKDPMVKAFWIEEFANYAEKYRTEAVAPIQNKVGQFLSSAVIRNIVGQPKSTIDLRDIMDNQKILLLDLSKGKVGEDNSALLGAMIITKLQLAALSRVDIPESERKDFYLYVDEFQNFVTDSFATILSEARKYRLNLTMGHQYIGQLTPENNTKVRDAVFGNVGSMIVFRVGAADAEYLETEFEPAFTPTDIVNLPKFHIVLKLMINGVASDPFTATTIPVDENWRIGDGEKVIKVSRERYANPREEVEEKIQRWMGTEFHEASADSHSAENGEQSIRRQRDLPAQKAGTGGYAASRERTPVTRPESNENMRQTDQNDQPGVVAEVSEVAVRKASIQIADDFLNRVKTPAKAPAFGPSAAAPGKLGPNSNSNRTGGRSFSKPNSRTAAAQPGNAYSRPKPAPKGPKKPDFWKTAQTLNQQNQEGLANNIADALEGAFTTAPPKPQPAAQQAPKPPVDGQSANQTGIAEEGQTYNL